MGASRNLAVGLFVLSAIALGIVLTVWITGQKGSEAASRYHVMIDSDVSGLMLGGPVFFMGVQVGTVTDLLIVPGNPAAVRVELRVDDITPVDTGTWATLAAQGITGVSVINLSAAPGLHEALVAQAEQELPVIPYRDSGFSALLSSAPAVMDKLDELLANANALINEENREAMRETLANVQNLSGSLAGQSESIAALPGTMDAALGDIREVTEQLQSLLVSAGPDARETLGNLERASGDLQAITSRLDGWLERHDDDIEAFGEEGLAQVPSLVEDTRAALEELEALLKTLRRDPSRAIYRPVQQEVQVNE